MCNYLNQSHCPVPLYSSIALLKLLPSIYSEIIRSDAFAALAFDGTVGIVKLAINPADIITFNVFFHFPLLHVLQLPLYRKFIKKAKSPAIMAEDFAKRLKE